MSLHFLLHGNNLIHQINKLFIISKLEIHTITSTGLCTNNLYT